ncbi:MAG: hypothetical protein LBR31_09565, partial [Desulfovibrio sp.]|nr:hypothetical protein [Desulfovibrio sp.]
MSTSFIYHAIGLPGYEYVHQKFEGGSVTFRVRSKWRLLRCPACKSKQVTRHFARPALQQVQYLAIDEISVRK